MRKSGNKKAIKNIVQRNLQSEKRRNVMLMISIALASFLICFSGLIATSLLEVKKKQIQDTYEAVYMNVSEEKLLKLREETGFERVGQYYIVGDIPSDKKYTATFFYMDQPMLYMMRNQMSLSSGKVPEEEKQIAVCKKWLEKYGKDKKVGDKINLNTDQLSGEYTISGILDMTTSGETFPFLISWEKLENYENYNEDSNMVYVHVKEKNVEDIKKHWMHIGKSDKKYEIIDDNNNKRIQAGSKGVGRFALSRLGCNIIMTTKKADNSGVVWKTDWNTSIIDTAENLIENGTTILIENLRERWNKNRISNLCEYIERTYFDDSMKIEIITDEFNKIIPKYFPTAEIGINCKSNLKLKYDNGILTTIIKSDEFDRKATKYCQGINLNEFESKLNVKDELKGSYIEEVAENDLERIVNGIGKFSANFYFNLSPTEVDKDKYLYKYTSIPEKIKGGIILYRNAFSISSYEGKKDWLGLGKRARKSPAAANHKSGSWRVRENQLAGYVLIDKKENYMLQDLANRQGLDENIYFQVFVEIICMGIKEHSL